MWRIIPLLVLAAISSAEDALPAFVEPAGTISLSQAIDAALLNNPQLRPYSLDSEIGAARVVQAGLRPNPELSLEIENIGLGNDDTASTVTRTVGVTRDGVAAQVDRDADSGGSGVFDDTEVTLVLSQIIELGGKRAARIKAAELESEVLEWDFEVARFEVVGEVLARFADVLAAQERLNQERDAVGLAESLANTVVQMVNAGSVSPLEARRANAEAEHARINMRGRERDWEQARLRLAAMWASTTPQFTAVAGDIAAPQTLPDLDSILTSQASHPELRRWSAELARREAIVAHERALGAPDLTVGLGYRATANDGGGGGGYSYGTEGILFSDRSGGDGHLQHSLVLEASIPLPLFHRNQGAIREAELKVERLSDEQQAWEAEFVAVVTQQHARAVAASERVAGLTERVLPELEKTFALTQEGYERGKFDFLRVLDAQRAVIDARLESLDARLTYLLSLAEIERLVGAGLTAPVAISTVEAETSEIRMTETDNNDHEEQKDE